MSWFNDPKILAKIAFAVYGDICSADTSDAAEETLHERVKRIHAGLAPENEFFVYLAWLGNCEQLNRIDQTPLPGITTTPFLRAPDFLAIVRYKGRQIPVLIEVKSSIEDTLTWSESYLNSLKAYASLLNMQLLISWKHNEIWTLTDVDHFEKKVTAFHLTWMKAMQENLMSELFGEVSIMLQEHFRFAVEAEIHEEMSPDLEVLIPEGALTFTVKDVGFFAGEQRLKNLANEYLWLLLACPQQNHVERVSKQRMRMIFYPESDFMFPLLHVLLMMAMWRIQVDETVDWNQVLREYPIPVSGSDIRQAAENGFREGLVRYVIHQVPQTMPDFLR